MQTWGLVSYNDACAKTGEKPKLPTTMNNPQQPTEPGKPVPPQPPANPEAAAKQEHWNGVMQNAIMVVPHMLSSLESDPPETGVEFGEFIIKRGPEKRVSYDKLRNLAEGLKPAGILVPGNSDLEKFVNAARFVFERLPPPLNRICGIPSTPQFLSEFFNYDEIKAQEEEQR